jgi:hypothetical protein
MNARAPALIATVAGLAVAVAACASGSPDGGSQGSAPAGTSAPSASSGPAGVGSSSERSHSLTVRLLEFARCMRAHGVTGFADPPAPGSNSSGSHPPGSMTYLGNSFNPNSPIVQAADRACRKYADASPVTPAGAARVQAQQLKYAYCMRAHGEPDFPDPSPNGGFSIPSSVDENSPAFQAAENACKDLLFLPGAGGS